MLLSCLSQCLQNQIILRMITYYVLYLFREGMPIHSHGQVQTGTDWLTGTQILWRFLGFPNENI